MNESVADEETKHGTKEEEVVIERPRKRTKKELAANAEEVTTATTSQSKSTPVSKKSTNNAEPKKDQEKRKDEQDEDEGMADEHTYDRISESEQQGEKVKMSLGYQVPLTRDPISVILPFLTISEFASRVWYSTAKSLRSRHDDCLVRYADKNQLQQRHLILLCSSSLRHHVSRLTAQLFEPIKKDQPMANATASIGSSSAKGDTSTPAVLPSNQQQLSWLNTIGESMPHLQSLTVKFVLSPSDKSDVGISAESIKFPPRLLCLRFHTTMGPEVLTKKQQQYAGSGNGPVKFEKWIVRLVSAVTSTDSLCSSLRILESIVTDHMRYPNSVVVSTSLHKLIALRRLALSSPRSLFAVDNAFLDAIRTIPQLTEFEGTTNERFAYLLRTPCKQSYRLLGDSALYERSHIRFGLPQSNKPSGIGNRNLDPDLLALSSADSLIELNALPLISPSFLSRFIRLRTLNLICRQDINWDADVDGKISLPAAFDSEDLVSAVSQCKMLKSLIIKWEMKDSEFTESHAERIVTPLHHLSYLSIIGEHQIRSLAFMTKPPHLISGLRYFIFVGPLASLSEYRSIYSLTRLQFLCLDHGIMEKKDITEWESESGVTSAALDAMFRPRSQLRASYFAKPWDCEAELKGPGELPLEYCPHLQHFIQSKNHCDRLKEWQEVADQAESERESELLIMP